MRRKWHRKVIHLLCCVLQEYRSALRLAIEFKQYPVVDAFLDTHPDVKPGLRGPPELDSTDKVTNIHLSRLKPVPHHFGITLSFQ